MTRRRALWISFAVSALLFVVLGGVDARLWDEGGPGIVGFELAFSGDEAERIRSEWGPDGRDAARLSLWLDFPFLLAYGAFWGLAAWPARVWVLAPAAAGLDLLENVMLMVVLGGGGSPLAAGVFAVLKFAALAVVVGYVLGRLAWRHRGVTAAGVGVLVLGLAVNTWATERATEPARADIGQIVRLPGGDAQVRVDGPRDGPAVVLVHGFGASMRWWDGVTPALARRLRVVRIDLLGHGGSEKPRTGYSIGAQADLVAQAVSELGLRRVAVVGHSMGGVVAVALAERHRAMVARVMLIGTPADDDDASSGGLLSRAAFWPVVGHANDRFASDGVARWVVERGFAPEFDPPRALARDVFGRTTWNAFHDSVRAMGDYFDERPLDRRLAATGVPLTAVAGEHEGHARRTVARFNRVPPARTVLMEGLDHSPQVESPARTAPLIEAFALGR